MAGLVSPALSENSGWFGCGVLKLTKVWCGVREELHAGRMGYGSAGIVSEGCLISYTIIEI